MFEGLIGKAGPPGLDGATLAAVGSDDYLRAFAKLVANPTQGHLRWTAQESEAFREVEGLRAETSAMGTMDTQGGFFIPLTLDPTALLTSAGSTNPLRQIARTVMCLTDEWRGITSAGIVGEWLSEGAQASDASPTFGQPTVPVFKSSEWIQWSYEVGQDGLDFVGQLGLLLSDGWTQLTKPRSPPARVSGSPPASSRRCRPVRRHRCLTR